MAIARFSKKQKIAQRFFSLGMSCGILHIIVESTNNNLDSWATSTIFTTGTLVTQSCFEVYWRLVYQAHPLEELEKDATERGVSIKIYLRNRILTKIMGLAVGSTPIFLSFFETTQHKDLIEISFSRHFIFSSFATLLDIIVESIIDKKISTTSYIKEEKFKPVQTFFQIIHHLGQAVIINECIYESIILTGKNVDAFLKQKENVYLYSALVFFIDYLQENFSDWAFAPTQRNMDEQQFILDNTEEYFTLSQRVGQKIFSFLTIFFILELTIRKMDEPSKPVIAFLFTAGNDFFDVLLEILWRLFYQPHPLISLEKEARDYALSINSYLEKMVKNKLLCFAAGTCPAFLGYIKGDMLPHPFLNHFLFFLLSSFLSTFVEWKLEKENFNPGVSEDTPLYLFHPVQKAGRWIYRLGQFVFLDEIMDYFVDLTGGSTYFTTFHNRLLYTLILFTINTGATFLRWLAFTPYRSSASSIDENPAYVDPHIFPGSPDQYAALVDNGSSSDIESKENMETEQSLLPENLSPKKEQTPGTDTLSAHHTFSWSKSFLRFFTCCTARKKHDHTLPEQPKSHMQQRI